MGAANRSERRGSTRSSAALLVVALSLAIPPPTGIAAASESTPTGPSRTLATQPSGPHARLQPGTREVARQVLATLPTATAPNEPLLALSRRLDDVRSHLQRIEQHVEAGSDTQAEVADLHRTLDDVARDHRAAGEALQTIKARLQAAGLSDKAKDVDTFAAQLDDHVGSLQRELRAVRSGVALDASAAATLHRALSSLRLPDAARGPVVPPTRLRHETGPVAPSASTVTGAGDSTAAATAPPGPGDLAQTPEVQFTPGIVQLAASLGNSPVRMYEHVRNTFRFEPYFGSFKGSEATRQTGAGNDYDLASLLIALLRSSGFPARYARGTAVIPAATVASWLGITDPWQAYNILTTAGIKATRLVDSHGVLVAYEVDRVWVRAFVPVGNYRGLSDDPASTGWAPLDPALKLQDLQAGLAGIPTSVPFNETACGSPQPGYLCQVQSDVASEFYRDQVNAFLPVHMPGTSIGDIPVSGPIRGQEFGLLPLSPPFRLVTLAGEFTEIPDTSRPHVTIELGGGSVLQTTFAPPVPVAPSNMPAVSARKTVSWVPATAADQATVDLFGGLPKTPAFLVNVKPQFKVEGAVQAEGAATPAGSAVPLQITLQFPDPDPLDATPPPQDVVPHAAIIAGSTFALGVDGNHISQDLLNTRAQKLLDANTARCAACAGTCDAGCAAAIDQDELLGELLNLAVTLHLDRLREGEDAILDLFHYKTVRRLYEGITKSNLNVLFLFDRPFAVTTANLSMDIPHMASGNIPIDGDTSQSAVLNRLTGLDNSAREHATWEELVGIESVSTVKVLQLAHAGGVPVLDNVAADTPVGCRDAVTRPVFGCSGETGCLGACGVNPVAIQVMCAELAAGRHITTPECPICPSCTLTLNQYTGTGWISADPVSDSAFYLLLGGIASADLTQGATTLSGTDARPIRPIDANRGAQLLAGLPLQTITPDNGATLLPQLQVPAALREYLAALVARGLTVTLSEVVVEVGGHDALILRTENPATGDAQFLEFAPMAGGAGTENPPAMLIIWIGNTGDGPGTTFGGDPVNLANGNFFRPERDLAIPALGFPLSFERFYNSGLASDGPLGIGWTHSYSEHLVPHDDGSVDWIDTHGGKFTFQPDGFGGFVTPPELGGSYDVLQSIPGGFVLSDKSGEVRQFDLPGRLVLRHDRYGNAQTLTYDGSGHLATVTDAAGRALTFTSDADGHILTVSDFTGRIWTYAYTGNHLVRVTFPSDAQTPAIVTQYAYHTGALNHDLMESITEANGGVRRLVYYANGRVFQTIDPEGGTVTYEYDLLHNRARVTDPDGFTSTYYFNAFGNLDKLEYPDGSSERWTFHDGGMTSDTDPLGFTQTLVYDAFGNLAQRENAAGAVTMYEYEPVFSNMTELRPPGSRRATYDYDAKGSLTTIHDAMGHTRSLTYDSHGLPLTVTDARGAAVTLTYNAAGEVTTRTTQLPSVETNTYTPRGALSTRTDADGRTTTYQYDLLDRLTYMTTADLHVTRFEYDAAGRNTRLIGPNGAVLQFTYDRNDRQTGVINPDNTTTTWTYDPAGNLTATTDELGRQTRMAYDARGRRVQIEYADGAIERATFDAAGHRTSVTDARGNTTRFEYDAVGRLVRATRPGGVVNAWTYDDNANLTGITDSRGGTTTLQYDALNRLTQVRAEGGRVQTYDYDANGNLTAFARYDVSGLATIPDDPRTLPPGRQRVATQTFDVLNRRTSLTSPNGGVISYTYDPAGQVIAITDPRGHTQHYEYDPHGNVTRLERADGSVVQIAYDTMGNRTQLTTPRGGVYRWDYDTRNRPTTLTDPLGAITTLTYDGTGHPLRQDNPDGTWVDTTYDPVGRPLHTQYSDGAFVRRVYDQAGNLTSLETDETTLLLSFDQLNRRASETLGFKGSTFTKTVGYAYDGESQLVQLTDPSGRTVQYTYDLAGRPTNIATSGGGPSLGFSYNGYGERATITYGNGIIGNYTYDGDGRITGIDYGTVGHLGYGRDAAGNATTLSELLASVPELLTIGYDVLNRPTSVNASTNPLRAETFAYDAAGNLTNPGDGSSPVFNLADQPTVNGSTTYTSDQRGNASTVVSAGQRLETTHNLNNRLEALRTFSGATLQRDLRLIYDGLGRLVEIRNGANATRIVHAFLNRLVEYDASGTVQVAYSPSPSLDEEFGATVGGQARYLHPDALGTVRAITGAAGTVVGSRQYSQFGRLIGTSGSPDVPLGYAGRPFDATTRLVDLRARWYDPTLGRFLGRDAVPPMPEDQNPYTYAANRPGQFIDPLGLQPTDPTPCHLQQKSCSVGQCFVQGAGGFVGFIRGLFGGMWAAAKGVYAFGRYTVESVTASGLSAYALTGLSGSNEAYDAALYWYETKQRPWQDPLLKIVSSGYQGDLGPLQDAVGQKLDNAEQGITQWWDHYNALLAEGRDYEAAQYLTNPLGYATGQVVFWEMASEVSVIKRPDLVGQEVNSWAVNYGNQELGHIGQSIQYTGIPARPLGGWHAATYVPPLRGMHFFPFRQTWGVGNGKVFGFFRPQAGVAPFALPPVGSTGLTLGTVGSANSLLTDPNPPPPLPNWAGGM